MKLPSWRRWTKLPPSPAGFSIRWKRTRRQKAAKKKQQKPRLAMRRDSAPKPATIPQFARVSAMMSERARKIALLLLVLAALFLPSMAMAEPLKVNNPGTGSVPLQGNWQFHLGDDKAWADPALDDSGWEQIHVDAPWGSQGHPSYTGFAWYRRR